MVILGEIMIIDFHTHTFPDRIAASSIKVLEDTSGTWGFTDGTNKALELYKNVTADESTFIRRLAKLTTGLRLEDWDDNTIIHFIQLT